MSLVLAYLCTAQHMQSKSARACCGNEVCCGLRLTCVTALM